MINSCFCSSSAASISASRRRYRFGKLSKTIVPKLAGIENILIKCKFSLFSSIFCTFA